jgi:hypothetical protein
MLMLNWLTAVGHRCRHSRRLQSFKQALLTRKQATTRTKKMAEAAAFFVTSIEQLENRTLLSVDPLLDAAFFPQEPEIDDPTEAAPIDSRQLVQDLDWQSRIERRNHSAAVSGIFSAGGRVCRFGC